MHNKQTYAKLIREWLNSEWKRLNKGKVGGSTIPFDKEKHMPLLTPRSKHSFVNIVNFWMNAPPNLFIAMDFSSISRQWM